LFCFSSRFSVHRISHGSLRQNEFSSPRNPQCINLFIKDNSRLSALIDQIPGLVGWERLE
jgi:hypothetical protein